MARPRRAPASLDGLRVGVAQVGATVGDVAVNLRLARRYARRAVRRGCDLLVFPECFVQGYSIRPEVLALAEPVDGPAARELRTLAARTGLAIVCGFLERNPADPAHPFNAALVIDASGEPVGVYRKTHLFEREHEAFARGGEYPVFELALGAGAESRLVPVGVSICADIEYPEVARLLALGGARLLAVPSADMDPYRVQQAANLASRAIENNMYIALANTVDRRRGVTFFGGSGIAGPDGSLVSAGYLRPRLVIATLSEAAVDASGGAGAYLRSRRPDTYRGLVPPTGETRSAEPDQPAPR
jgi:predicted amidohydrolase